MSRTDPLPRRSPESQGIRPSAILAFVNAVESQVRYLHSFMLLRHGVVVAEGWWEPYGPRLPHLMFSLTKSFTSTAVGMAVDQGLLSVDDRVAGFFPGALPRSASKHARAMRVRHLLSMSTGHDKDATGPTMDDPDGNHARGFFSVPVVHRPGTHFLYNTGASHILAEIIHKLTGRTLRQYLKPRLLDPLGIRPDSWAVSRSGINTGGTGLCLHTEDIARFGQFYLQRGVWRGRRLLSESWIAQATSKQISNGTDPKSDWAQGYCFQFWRSQHGIYRGDGAFGQYCVVMPEQDAVLAMTGGMGDMQSPLSFVWKHLLPAMRSRPIAANPASRRALQAKLARLQLEPVDGTLRRSHVAAGKNFVLDENPRGLRALRLTLQGRTAILHLQAGTEKIRLRFGYRTWAKGTSSRFGFRTWGPGPVSPDGSGERPVAGSFAWTAPNTWQGVLWACMTPYRYSFTCRFADGAVILEMSQNVSFGGNKVLTVVGRAGVDVK